MFISVVLPEPEGPISATYSPDRCRGHAPQRPHLDFAKRIGLPNVANLDQPRAGKAAVRSTRQRPSNWSRPLLYYRANGRILPTTWKFRYHASLSIYPQSLAMSSISSRHTPCAVRSNDPRPVPSAVAFPRSHRHIGLVCCIPHGLAQRKSGRRTNNYASARRPISGRSVVRTHDRRLLGYGRQECLPHPSADDLQESLVRRVPGGGAVWALY